VPIGEGRVDAVIDATQPGFAPPRVDRARAEPTAVAAVATADDAFERHTVAFQLDHLSRAFLDEPLDPGHDLAPFAEVPDHFMIEPQSSISALGVERRLDLGSGTNLDEVAGPQAEFPLPRISTTRGGDGKIRPKAKAAPNLLSNDCDCHSSEAEDPHIAASELACE
jgi:hypothetical protein